MNGKEDRSKGRWQRAVSRSQDKEVNVEGRKSDNLLKVYGICRCYNCGSKNHLKRNCLRKHLDYKSTDRERKLQRKKWCFSADIVKVDSVIAEGV